MNDFQICGLAVVNGSFKNIIMHPETSYSDKRVKEVIYSTDFGDVESLIGFTDVNIVGLDVSDSKVSAARMFIEENDYVEGIIFLDNGFLVITDLMFFSAFTRIDGKDTPYTTLVESNTYEDSDATTLIEEDYRLQ